VKNKKGTAIPDTIASWIYGPLGAILPGICEMGMFHFTFWQWFVLHCLFSIRILLNGWICGMLADYFGKKCHKTILSVRISDVLALYSYELPLYAISAAIVGASRRQILLGLIIQIINNALLGKPFRIIIDWMRRYFSSRSFSKQTSHPEQLEPVE
jgi:hypothetical protein